jgi:hypothetical protein
MNQFQTSLFQSQSIAPLHQGGGDGCRHCRRGQQVDRRARRQARGKIACCPLRSCLLVVHVSSTPPHTSLSLPRIICVHLCHPPLNHTCHCRHLTVCMQHFMVHQMNDVVDDTWPCPAASEKAKLLQLEGELHRRVIGQEQAVTSVAEAGKVALHLHSPHSRLYLSLCVPTCRCVPPVTTQVNPL